MPASTARLALPYPVGTDPNDYPGQMQTLATALDTKSVVYLEGTFAARPPASVHGRLYHATDTNNIYYDTGVAWLLVTDNPAAAVTTKGDLLVASAAGALARLGAGGNGQVLTAQSGATNGVQWSTPADTNPLPKGVLARGKYTTSNTTTGTTPTTAKKSTQLGAELQPGRLYRIGADNVPLTNSSTANTCFLQLTFTLDGSAPAVTSTRLVSAATNTASLNYVECGISVFATVASITTFTVLLAYYGTAGTTYLGAATDWPVELTIEDAGVDPGVTGINF